VLAVGIALTASACWGVADFMAGLLSRRRSALLILLVQQLVGAVIVGFVVSGRSRTRRGARRSSSRWPPESPVQSRSGASTARWRSGR
jgi:hypothetical protein